MSDPRRTDRAGADPCAQLGCDLDFAPEAFDARPRARAPVAAAPRAPWPPGIAAALDDRFADGVNLWAATPDDPRGPAT
jgi:hypothetical protein